MITGTVGLAGDADAHDTSASVAPFAFHEIRNNTHPGQPFCMQPTTPNAGALIIQVGCNGSSTQGWAILNDGSNEYRFLNDNTGLCIFGTDNPAGAVAVTLVECEGATGGIISNAPEPTRLTERACRSRTCPRRRHR